MPLKKKKIIKKKKTSASDSISKNPPKYNRNRNTGNPRAKGDNYGDVGSPGTSHDKSLPSSTKKKFNTYHKIEDGIGSTPNYRFKDIIIASRGTRASCKKRRDKSFRLTVSKKGPSTHHTYGGGKIITIPPNKSANNATKTKLNKVLNKKQYDDLNIFDQSARKKNNGGVIDKCSPFNRCTNKISRIPDLKNHNVVMPYRSNYRQMGLSPKEKSYVIGKCQARSTRYSKLKNIAATAIKENKIFTVYGKCNAVRKALMERGWVEKYAPCKMNLSRIQNGTFANKNDIFSELEKLLISNLVEKSPPNFIWRTKEEQCDTGIDMSKDNPSIVNKLKVDAIWTSKQGLCLSMKRNYWFFIDDVAEVNGPRTYNCYDTGELEGFIKDYQMSACTSLLKWILSMVANDRPIFSEAGKISINVIVFALNRCKEYLFRKQNKDIDKSLRTATGSQWKTFLKKYYCVIAKHDIFVADKDNKLPLYLGYAKFLLKEIHRFRPQLSCEGCHNIWIIKPAHCSRGRGIRMASRLSLITSWLRKSNAKYVVQKYIEEPLLIHETKFDIRQYYLVTSTYPLVIWMYADCYLKFSSQKYNLKNYHESIHLTNNAVQKKYKNCVGRHEELPQCNMWDLDRYKEYLHKIGMKTVWDNVIYPGMKKCIIGIMLSCQDSLSVCKNRFEVYGCDFILDKEYKPWLIEINSCPDLNATTPVTAKICPAAISDIIKVVIDYANDPKSQTGKFECIYRQPITTPRYGCASDLMVRGYSLPLEYFYRGNVLVRETYEDADIEKERDIKSILSKLKDLYDVDIMVEPDQDSNDGIQNEKPPQKAVPQTDSEYELSVAASVINEQIDELIDKISEQTTSTKSLHIIEVAPSSTTPATTNQSTKSEIDIGTLVRRRGSRFASSSSLNIGKPFRFSKLDDGPCGKGSVFEYSESKSKSLKLKLPINTFSISQAQGIVLESNASVEPLIQSANKLSKGQENVTTNSYTNILQATNRIISFINKKEREYSSKYF